jgi:hypothetical protein
MMYVAYFPPEKRGELGHGENLFSVHIKRKVWLGKFSGKKERLTLFGGRGYACREGYEVIVGKLIFREKQSKDFDNEAYLTPYWWRLIHSSAFQWAMRTVQHCRFSRPKIKKCG